jgi:hypothetical protein
MLKYNVSFVLVPFGALIQYSGDDLKKILMDDPHRVWCVAGRDPRVGLNNSRGDFGGDELRRRPRMRRCREK